MKKYKFFLSFAVILVLTALPCLAITIDHSTYRIAISNDGNAHDKDDIIAAPMAMAMIAESCEHDKYVHHDYSCHIWDDDGDQPASMRNAVEGALDRWDMPDRAYEARVPSQLTAAIANFAAEGNASSSSDRLYYACGGPMEVPYQCISAVSSSKQQYVTAISHSTWNENHSHDGSHVWDDIQDDLGCQTIEISDQNVELNPPESEFYWLRDMGGKYTWLYNLNEKTNWDCSDSGMVAYILTGRGDQGVDPADLEDLFKDSQYDNCGSTCGPFDAFSTIEAEDYCSQSGIQTQACSEGGENVAYINDNDWCAYYDVDFGSTGANSFDARVASNTGGGNIEIHLDSTTGSLVGTCVVTGTGGWQNWVTETCSVSGASGVHDLYLVFTGGTGSLFNVNWFKFSEDIGPCVLPWTDTDFTINNETVNYSSGSINISCVSSVDISMDLEGVGSMEDADYLNVYYTVDGGSAIPISLNVNAFALKTVSATGITGNSVTILIDGATSVATETYYVSNMSVSESGENPNIRGEWTFDVVDSTTVYDSSAYGHDGTRSGGTIVTGNTGDAMYFDGVDDSVTLPAAAFSTISDEVTVALWVNGDAIQPVQDVLFRAVDASGNRVLNIHLPWSNSRVYWDAGNSGSSYDRIYATASASQFEGQWNHWVFVKDATSGDMTIYLNGAEFHSGTGKTMTMSGITSVTLGSSPTGENYTGSIDEVILYDTALSASEVSDLYNSY